MEMANQLDQLKRFTKVVADTGDFESMRVYEPLDATTNPSLILKAAQQEAYSPLVDRAVTEASRRGLEAVIDRLLILFGAEILAIVPGRVSTEVDARLSFDAEGTVAKARRLIDLYESEGIDRERVLIKIASTWEGIEAATRLEKEGIRCNLTLMFSLVQAVACAEGGIRLISPFVGRIYDWYRRETGRDYTGSEDPGVRSVRRIYAYYRRYGHDTEVMGASFRNTGQILELAGCDLLTISPDLLEALRDSTEPVTRKLDPVTAATEEEGTERLEIDEKTFRYLLNEDAMATEKTAEGIRKFSADMGKLEELILSRMG